MEDHLTSRAMEKEGIGKARIGTGKKEQERKRTGKGKGRGKEEVRERKRCVPASCAWGPKGHSHRLAREPTANISYVYYN